MPFRVPETYQGLYDEVVGRFRRLLYKGVVTGISDIRLNQWLTNFVSDEEKYLAARVLENLTFRSEAMVSSAIEHLCECILPCELRRLGIGSWRSVDEFVGSLAVGSDAHPVRFVAVDGTHEQTPGKSGAVIIREFHRHGRVHKSLTCRPENLGSLPLDVRCLVFVDDMLGTGRQFATFAEHYSLHEYRDRLSLIYSPLIAHEKGLQKLRRDCSWLTVLPVEEFNSSHQFFRSTTDDPNLWAIDGINSVNDVRQHVRSMSERGGISATTSHSLNLLLGFQHATPNNSLPILYAQSARWQNLLIR